jgi:hypothetical protein
MCSFVELGCEGVGGVERDFEIKNTPRDNVPWCGLKHEIEI